MHRAAPETTHPATKQGMSVSTPDFTYINNDGHVLLVWRNHRAMEHALKEWHPRHEHLGGAYIFDPQEAIVERHCLREAGFIVVTV